MRNYCIELLHYITYAIDNDLGDEEIDKRIEEVASSLNITNEEYSQIYDLVMLAYKNKYN